MTRGRGPWTGDRGPRTGDRPPWWPENEPWPPRGGRYYRERRRSRFIRRSGWLSFLPLWGLLWLISSGLPWRIARNGLPFDGGFAILLLCAAVAGAVAFAIRRVAAPVADVVAAADRIANRDYRVRVDVPRSAPSWVRDTAVAFNAMAQELESQDEARRNLMADVAHELRTPLAVVQGKLEGILDGVYAPDTERLQELLDETRVLTRLVEDLRTLSSAESGAMALRREPTDVVALANDVVASLAGRAAETGMDVRVEPAPAEIEPVTIDPVRIREVLVNLAANALRYTPRDGRVTIGVSGRPAAVEITVADTGEGISAEELPRIFDRFYKGSGSAGSGLGLTIARRLVEAHGGTIRVDSRRGAGTTFTVNLPRT